MYHPLILFVIIQNVILPDHCENVKVVTICDFIFCIIHMYIKP